MAHVCLWELDLVCIIFCFVPSTKSTQCLAQSGLENYRRCTLDLTWESRAGGYRARGLCLPPHIAGGFAFYCLLSQWPVCRRQPGPTAFSVAPVRTKLVSDLSPPLLSYLQQNSFSRPPPIPPPPCPPLTPVRVGGWQRKENEDSISAHPACLISGPVSSGVLAPRGGSSYSAWKRQGQIWRQSWKSGSGECSLQQLEAPGTGLGPLRETCRGSVRHKALSCVIHPNSV